MGWEFWQDEGLGNVTATLKAEGMWTVEDPTIIVFTDENVRELAVGRRVVALQCVCGW
eukprot:COSAG01_NODE_8022_length_2950_cov_4.937215_4_plen_58_part_00